MSQNYNGVDIPDGPIGYYINSGLDAINKNLSQSAGLQFRKAIEIDKTSVYILRDLFKTFVHSKNSEACLVIGLNLLPFIKNAPLANALGNYARKTGNSQQALELYKLALQFKKSFIMSAYNIAATLANSDYFDDRAMNVAKFIPETINFISPEFYIEKNGEIFPTEDYFSQFHADLLRQKENEKQEKIESLEIKLTELKDFQKEFLDLKAEIEKVEKTEIKLIQAEIEEYAFQFMNRPENISQDIYKYNLAILNIKRSKFNEAYKILKEISDKSKFKYFYLLIAICFGESGYFKDAYDMFVELLGKDSYDRYYNVNFGLLNRKQNKIVSSAKYLIKGFMLLKDSNNIYDKDIIEIKAYESLNAGLMKEARHYYRLLINEGVYSDSVPFHYATILIKENKVKESVQYLDMAISSRSTYQTKAEKLKESIYQDLFTKGVIEQEQKKYKFAVGYYISALEIARPITLLKRILHCMGNYKLNYAESEMQKKLSTEASKLLEEEKFRKEKDEKEKKLAQQIAYMNS